MRNEGWAARNAKEAMPMFACPGADPLGCFAQQTAKGVAVFPQIKDTVFSHNWANGPTPQTQRLLLRVNAATNFWMRVSPDGRFIGNGVAEREQPEFGGSIADLRALY